MNYPLGRQESNYWKHSNQREPYVVYNEEKPQMTREEAIKKLDNTKHKRYSYPFLEALEVLGLIKFEEEKAIKIFEVTEDNVKWASNKDYVVAAKKYGVIRLEQWPEGLVLWVGGEIVYRSWSWKDAS